MRLFFWFLKLMKMSLIPPSNIICTVGGVKWACKDPSFAQSLVIFENWQLPALYSIAPLTTPKCMYVHSFLCRISDFLFNQKAVFSAAFCKISGSFVSRQYSKLGYCHLLGYNFGLKSAQTQWVKLHYFCTTKPSYMFQYWKNTIFSKMMMF